MCCLFVSLASETIAQASRVKIFTARGGRAEGLPESTKTSSL